MDFREGPATVSLEKLPKLITGLKWVLGTRLWKVDRPSPCYNAGRSCVDRSGTEEQGSNWRAEINVVSIRLAGSNWKPMHHSGISVPYWKHAARAVRVEPVGTA